MLALVNFFRSYWIPFVVVFSLYIAMNLVVEQVYLFKMGKERVSLLILFGLRVLCIFIMSISLVWGLVGYFVVVLLDCLVLWLSGHGWDILLRPMMLFRKQPPEDRKESLKVFNRGVKPEEDISDLF